MTLKNERSITMEKLVSLCKRRGFVFPSSDIYGGISGAWDYGPLGVELKRNIKDLWWQAMICEDNIVGIDTSILMNPKVWEASGHTESFTDPLIDDKVSKMRYRADHLIEGYIDKLEKKGDKQRAEDVRIAYKQALDAPVDEANKALYRIIIGEKIHAPNSGAFDWTDVRQFNLMFETKLGALSQDTSRVYLRPETAQGIFVNFHAVRESARMKIPFGIAQIGKAFRNEIVKGNFIFRQIEFDQMEMQYFVRPGLQKEAFSLWKEKRFQWLSNTLGLCADKLVWYKHDKLAHYADDAYDIKYRFPFGEEEIEGIHSRTDFDLKRHQEYSGKNMHYHEPESKESYIPCVVETSIGVDRALLAVLCDAYSEDVIEGEPRVFFKFDPKVAPIKAAIFPLIKKDGLPEMALSLKKELKRTFLVRYDESGSIGRRYRRQDEIGTPFSITIDHDSLMDQSVTIRHRDTTKQERISLSKIKTYLLENMYI